MMNRKHNLYGVYSVIGLIVVLGIALGSDFLMASLGRRNAVTFSLTFIIFWSNVLLALLVTAASLLLFWFVLNQAPRNIWVALIFLLAGLLIVTYPVLYFIPTLGGSFYPPPQLNNILLSSHSYTSSLGGIIAVTGLFAFILPRGKR